jgi:uncharacterized phage protein gp47/JayE
MAFARPTLADLVSRIQADLVSRLGGSGAPLRRSVVAVFSRVHAGAVHMLHGHLEYLSRQLFPDLSDDAYLVRQASLYGLSKSAATYATGTVSVPGEIGAVVPAGSVMRRPDGAEYTVDSEATVPGAGPATVSVTASLAGADYSLDEGATLSFESPIVDMDASGTVDAGAVDGTDVESTESLRTRLLARLREAPQGGAENDYTLWALEVPGVTRVWVYPNQLGAGTVVVYFVRDDDVGSIIPSGGEVTAVQDYIDGVRPVTAAVTVAAPTAVTWNFTLEIVPDTADVRDAVEAELTDLFRTEGEPGVTLPLSRVRTAIGIATGLTDYTLTTPAADLTHSAGEIPVLGTITWV